MLVKTEINNIPKPQKNNLFKNKMINIDNYFSHFKPVSPMEAILFDSTAQVVVALLYRNSNSEQPINIALPTGAITSFEILDIPFVKILPSLFKVNRLIINGNNIVEVFIKGLLDETRESFKILKESNKIDPCLNKLLRSNIEEDFSPLNVTAFEVKYLNSLSDSGRISLALSNKFFSYLLIQSIRYNGLFSIPFCAWRKDEIENEHYFNDLTKLFKKIFVVGAGREWESTYLIVSEPFKDIVDCIVDDNLIQK
ncbi:MAG: hypothetical protein WA125_02765 [Desulfosporosinus sp.]